MILRRAAFIVCLALLLVGGGRAAQAQVVSDPNLSVTVYASGFINPTQVRFIGPNDALVTEKNTGRVMRWNNGVLTTALDLGVGTFSERGLLGLTLDPNFATNGFVYAYYSAAYSDIPGSAVDTGGWVENRLSRFTWDGTGLVNEVKLRSFGTAADGQANGPNHDAGPIMFGPDGMLYGTTGDLNRFRAEQNNTAAATSSALVGGIYRLNSDGTIPADNPFLAFPDPGFHPWFAYGVRNTYGMTFDPLTGNLWDTENGPNVYDEINLVQRGFNSGWNQIMGPDSRDPQGIGDLVNLPGSAYSDPEFSFLTPVAVTGLAFLANTGLDTDYRDALLVGDANNGNLYLFRLNPARDAFVLGGGLSDLVADDLAERSAVQFGQGFGGVTDIQTGWDGAVYVTSIGTGNIYRIQSLTPAVAAPEHSSAALLLLAAGMGGAAAARKVRRRRM